MKLVKLTQEKLRVEQEFDLYTRTAVYEALDECGIYDNEQGCQDAAWDYVRYIRSKGLFQHISSANYEAFMLSVISFLELRTSGDSLLVEAAKVLENRSFVHLSD